MTPLDGKQTKILKKLLKKSLSSFEEIKPELFSAYCFLKQEGYISIETKQTTDSLPNGLIGINTDITHIGISEKGKSYLYNERLSLLRFFIPLVISVCAVVISIIGIIS